MTEQPKDILSKEEFNKRMEEGRKDIRERIIKKVQNHERLDQIEQAIFEKMMRSGK